MFEYNHIRRSPRVKDKQKYPAWLKGFAQFLYAEKGLQRMQVQGTIYVVTGYDVSKHTLKTWLYVDNLRGEV